MVGVGGRDTKVVGVGGRVCRGVGVPSVVGVGGRTGRRVVGVPAGVGGREVCSICPGDGVGGLRRRVVVSPPGVGGRPPAVVGVIGRLLRDVVVFWMLGAGVGGLRLLVVVVVGVVGVRLRGLVESSVSSVSSVLGVGRRRRRVVGVGRR